MPLATAPRYQDRMPARPGVAEAGLAGAAGGGGLGVGVDEQVGHGPGPDLAVGVEAVQPGQVTEPVRAAPGVQRIGEVLVPLVAVADDGALISGEDAAGVDRLAAPVTGVHGGEELGARHVHVAQLPGGPGGSLVGVQHPGGGQQHPVHERRQQPGGLAPDALPTRPRRSPRSARRPAGRRGRRAGSSRRPPGPSWRAPAARTAPAGYPVRGQPDGDLPALRALLRGDLTRSPPAEAAVTPRRPAVSAVCPAPARRPGRARSSRTRPACRARARIR